MRKTRENQRFPVNKETSKKFPVSQKSRGDFLGSRKFGKFSGKAQGLSITTIIVAAIALIVLVVLIAIFTGRIGVFSGGVDASSQCSTLGGTCSDTKCAETTPATKLVLGATDCGREGLSDRPFCCR